jgi:hypothetical protein
LAIALVGLAARALGVGGFDPYPVIEIDADASTLLLAAAIPVAAGLPFLAAGRRGRRG